MVSVEMGTSSCFVSSGFESLVRSDSFFGILASSVDLYVTAVPRASMISASPLVHAIYLDRRDVVIGSCDIK